MGAKDERRRDYTGRALLFHIEKLFPGDKDTSRRIVSEKIKGKLPRQTARGLINSIGSCNSYKLDSVILPHVAKHLVAPNQEMDYDAFAMDGAIRVIVAHAIKKLENFFESMSGEDQKQWLLDNISESESFDEMERGLSEEELDLIIANIFKV